MFFVSLIPSIVVLRSDLLAYFLNLFPVILAVKYLCAHNDHIPARLDNLFDVIGLNTAVNFKVDLSA